MINPKLISMRRDLKYFEIMLYKKYKERVSDYTEIINYKTANKLLEYKILFDEILNPSTEDEIFYFKNIKAKLLAIVYLCNYIKNFDNNNIAIKYHKKQKYCIKQLAICRKEIFRLDDYYYYYRTKATYFDHKFFVRIEINLLRTNGTEILEIDSKSNTPYLFLFAKATALFHFKKYIYFKLKELNDDSITNKSTISNKSNLQWTASKSDIIELVYALHAAGVFNNGKATIKDIVDSFQELSNSDLSNHNRIFHDIKLRKKIKTKHIDHLKKVLLQKIKNTDYQLFDD